MEPWVLSNRAYAPGHAALKPLPKLGVSHESQGAEFVPGALQHLGLGGLRLHQGLDGLCTCTHCLALLACIFFRPFLSCFLAKGIFFRKLGSNPLRHSCICDQGFLMPFLCHFGTGFVWCGSWTWLCLHGNLRLPQCLGLEELQFFNSMTHISNLSLNKVTF